MIDRNNSFFKQVELLVRVLPFVAEESCFAVKGGTAINLFIRDLPRLSVDVDLVYLPIQDRTTSLRSIEAALKAVASRAEKAVKGLRVTPSSLHETGTITKLMVELGSVRIKVEVNPVLRGTLFPSERLPVTNAVSDVIGYAEAKIVSFQDLYAGKICAALDRQHPRDLFDVRHLLNTEGITEDLFNAFLVYLISHNRPVSEILSPNLKDISNVFVKEFKGMTFDDVSLEELYDTRRELIDVIHQAFKEPDKKFLLTFKSGDPDWSLLNIDIARELPSVKWKLRNIRNMSSEKRNAALLKLENVLR